MSYPTTCQKPTPPASFPKHICDYTDDTSTKAGEKVVSWKTYPTVFRTKDGKDAVLAVNNAATVFALLAKKPDGSWEVDSKLKAFGRNFQWLTVTLGNRLDPAST